MASDPSLTELEDIKPCTRALQWLEGIVDHDILWVAILMFTPRVPL